MAKGIVVVAKPSLFPAGAKTMLALPHLLRLVRSGLVDNGFVGIRAVIQLKQFQQALMAQEQPQDGGEKPAPVAFEIPDFMPEETEAKQPSAATSEHFANLVEGEYTLVSEKGTAKYLVCNPTHKWLVVQHDDLLYLCSCSMKTVAMLAKKDQIIPTNFFSLI